MRIMRIDRIFGSRGLVALLLGLVALLARPQAALSQTFAKGDVFIAIGHSQVQWRNASGVLIKTLAAPVAGNAATTGMAFDSATNLYVTMFDSQAVAVFDNSRKLSQTLREQPRHERPRIDRDRIPV